MPSYLCKATNIAETPLYAHAFFGISLDFTNPSCVYKKCTLLITCFSHTVKQAICHLELTKISKTMIDFSESAKNFRRGSNIYFLNILIFNLQAF